MPQPSPVQIILRLAKPEWRLYSIAFLLIVLTNMADLVWVRLTALAVEASANGTMTARAFWTIIVLALLIFVLRWTNRNCSFLAGRKIERRLRTSIFRNTLGASQEEMDSHRTGDLVSRIINDVTDIRMVVGSGFLQLSNNLIAYTLTIGAMVLLRPELAITALVPFVPLFFVARKLTAIEYELTRKAQDALGGLSSHVEEAVGGAEVLKAYTAEKWQEDRFKAANDRHFRAELATALPESLFISMMGAIVWIGIAAILLASSFVAAHGIGGLSIADVTTFIFLFVRLVWPTVALGWIMNVIQRGLAAARRLGEFITPRLEHPGSKTAPRDGAVEFEDASYTYPGRSVPAVSEVGLRISDGEWVGIVGPTACGKTTLARLIAGLRLPTQGDVVVGGVKIAELDENLRARVVHLATQVPTLFSMDVENNLRLAAPETDHDLQAVVDDVAFGDELSMMPEGLKSKVGEKGLLLSGGQRQRLSLARAFLADPKVLVLDDILSAVDLKTELAVLSGIERRRSGKTTIFITHRLPVLSRLNRIIVMENGRVTADGSLAEALQTSEWLRATFEAERLSEAL